jgi:probable rRNA maturation factor
MNAGIEIILDDERWRNHIDPEQFVARVVSHIEPVTKLNWPALSGASVLFCSDARIQELNLRWMSKDAPTNVLSFPAIASPVFGSEEYLGDIAIAFETIVSEAKNEKKTVEQHASHMLIHGFLHLLGLDHKNDEEATLMESIESEILVSMGMGDPWVSYKEKSIDDE